MRFSVISILALSAVVPLGLAHDHDDHTDEAGTGTISPSPTESVGCEAHGDHWLVKRVKRPSLNVFSLHFILFSDSYILGIAMARG